MTTERRTIACPNCHHHDGYTVFIPAQPEDTFYCESCEEHFTVSDLYRCFDDDPVSQAECRERSRY